MCAVLEGIAVPIDTLTGRGSDPRGGSEMEPPNDFLVDRLLELPVPRRSFDLVMSPSERLIGVEIALFTSVDKLESEQPVTRQCLHSCGSWISDVRGIRRWVRIPTKDVAAGEVIVVKAFFDTGTSLEPVSWGMVLSSD
jgi:hypothetical protein